MFLIEFFSIGTSITIEVLCLQSRNSIEFEQRFTSFDKRIGKL